MDYEEKLRKYRNKEPLYIYELNQLDYFRFIRDGAMEQIKYNHVGLGADIYEVHCREVTDSYKLFVDDVFWVNDRCSDSEDPFKDFIHIILEQKTLKKYMYLDTKFYLIELDPLETWE